jgi:hypothetical protein
MIVNKEFRVVFVIDVCSTDPTGAAALVDQMLKDKDYHWQFYVQEHAKRRTVYDVDFEEDPPEVKKLFKDPEILLSNGTVKQISHKIRS